MMYYDFVVQCLKRKTLSFSFANHKTKLPLRRQRSLRFLFCIILHVMSLHVLLCCLFFLKQVMISNGSEHTTKQTTHFKSLLGSNSVFSPCEISQAPVGEGAVGFLYLNQKFWFRFQKMCWWMPAVQTYLAEFLKVAEEKWGDKIKRVGCFKETTTERPNWCIPRCRSAKKKRCVPTHSCIQLFSTCPFCVHFTARCTLIHPTFQLQ